MTYLYTMLLSCRLSFIAMYVNNNGVRINCPKLMEKFERHVADDKRIDLVGEGDMSLFLSTRYYFDFQTGQIPADQDCYLDDLAANHGLTNSNSCELSMEPSVGLIPLPAQTNQSRVSVFSMIF